MPDVGIYDMRRFKIDHEEFEYAEGEVIFINRNKGRWSNWSFVVQYTKKSCINLRIPPSESMFSYKPSTNYFDIDTLPSVGDRVKLRCRLSDDFPFFRIEKALMVETLE